MTRTETARRGAGAESTTATGDGQPWLKAGAILYVLWGLAHVVVAAIPLITRLRTGPSEMFAFAELTVPADQIDAAWRHAANLIAEYYFDIGALGILAIIVAIGLIWKGQAIGFAINAIVLGIADGAFLFLEVVPGYQPLWPPGPVIGLSLYVSATIATAVGFLQLRRGRSTALQDGHF